MMVDFTSSTRIAGLGLLFTAALTTATCHNNFKEEGRNIPVDNEATNDGTADEITKSPGRIAGEGQNEKDACPDTILPTESDQCKIITEDDGKGGLPVILCGCNPNHYLHELPSDREDPASRNCLPCPLGEEINIYAHKERKCKKKKGNPSPAPLNATQTAPIEVTTQTSLITTQSSLMTSHPRHDNDSTLAVLPTPKTEVIQMSPVGSTFIGIASVVVFLLLLLFVCRKCGKKEKSPFSIRYFKSKDSAGSKSKPSELPDSNRDDVENSSGGARTNSGVPAIISPAVVTTENERRSSHETLSASVPIPNGSETQQNTISSSDATLEELQSLLNGDEHLGDSSGQSAAQETEETALSAAGDSSDPALTFESLQHSSNMSAASDNSDAVAESNSSDTNSLSSSLNQNILEDSSQPCCSRAARPKNLKLPSKSHCIASKNRNKNFFGPDMDCISEYVKNSNNEFFKDDSFDLALKYSITPPHGSENLDPKERLLEVMNKGCAEKKITSEEFIKFLGEKGFQTPKLEMLGKLFDEGHLKMKSRKD